MYHMTTTVHLMTSAERVNIELARVLAAAIKTDGKTQREVAAATGIPLATLSRRLTGRSSFTVSELAAITTVLDVSIVDVLLRVERLSSHDDVAV